MTRAVPARAGSAKRLADRSCVAAALVGLTLGACAGAPRHAELRHGNGTPAQAGTLVDGLQEGEWTFWNDRGVVIARGTYRHDERDGLWTHWYDSGRVRMRGEYRGQRQVGPWEFFHDNEALQCRGEYRAGREQGEWVFAHPNGQEQQRGWFDDGKRQLRWVEHGADGRLLAEGSYLDDVPVGRWRRRDAAGDLVEVDYALPPEVAHVLETWDDGSLRREGFTRGGVPFGTWATHHRGAGLRAVTTRTVDGPVGELVAYDGGGEVVARGPLSGGQPEGAWMARAVVGLVQRQVVREPAPPFDRTWSDAEPLPGGDPLVAARRWLAELCSPCEAGAVAVAGAAPPVEPKPEAPTDPGTFTVRERAELAMYRRYYRDGWLPPGQDASERYGVAEGSARLGNGDASLGAACLGKPLPVESFPTPGGEQLRLETLRGKRVLFVVLRGFTSQVCVYCFAQTAELAPLAPRFLALDCEVVVLFPGSRSRLAAFASACADEFGDQPPPYHLVYDPDLELARALGLQANLARPAAFVLDRAGIVRHAYVAESEVNVADRPPASDLLRWVEATR